MSSPKNDRKTIALLMGWRYKGDFSTEWRGDYIWVRPDGLQVSSDSEWGCIPDPYTNASDDYAVLEWMRENWKGRRGHHGRWYLVATLLHTRLDSYNVDVPYVVGDYLRAYTKSVEANG